MAAVAGKEADTRTDSDNYSYRIPALGSTRNYYIVRAVNGQGPGKWSNSNWAPQLRSR